MVTPMSERTTGGDRTAGTGGLGKWVSALVAVAGLWLVVQALVFGLVPANFWNDVVVGLVLIALGGYNYSERAGNRTANTAATTLVALLGLWLVAAPFVYSAEAGFSQLGFWNDVLVGLLVLVLGAYSTYRARESRTAVPAGQ